MIELEYRNNGRLRELYPLDGEVPRVGPQEIVADVFVNLINGIGRGRSVRQGDNRTLADTAQSYVYNVYFTGHGIYL